VVTLERARQARRTPIYRVRSSGTPPVSNPPCRRGVFAVEQACDALVGVPPGDTPGTFRVAEGDRRRTSEARAPLGADSSADDASATTTSSGGALMVPLALKADPK